MAWKVRASVPPWDTPGRVNGHSASSAPSKRGELCTHRAAHANEEGGSGQLAAFVLFTTGY